MYFTITSRVRHADGKEETLKNYALFKKITKLEKTTLDEVSSKVKKELELKLGVEVLESKVEPNLV